MTSPWRIHDIDPHGVYAYDSPSIIPDEMRGVWLEEARQPVVYRCTSCGEMSPDLRSIPLVGHIHPRTSVRHGGLPHLYSTRPWTIECPQCHSIYILSNGWIEPNNGRMLSVLDDLHRIRLLESITDPLVVPMPDLDGEKKRRVGYHPRRYWDVFLRLAHTEIRFTVESLYGRRIASGPACFEVLLSELPYESPFGKIRAAQSYISDVPASLLRDLCSEALESIIQRMLSARTYLVRSTAAYISGMRIAYASPSTAEELYSPELSQAVEALLWSIYTEDDLAMVPGLQVKDLLT